MSTPTVAPPTPTPASPSADRARRAATARRWLIPLVTAIIGVAAGAAIGASGKPGTNAGAPAPVTVTSVETVTETVTADAPTPLDTAPVAPDGFGEGTYVVGTDIQPGRYHTGGSASCYWARLSSLTTSDIIDNHFGTGPQTVAVLPGDTAFMVSGDCVFAAA